MRVSEEISISQSILCPASSYESERRIYLAAKKEEDLLANLRKKGIRVIRNKSTKYMGRYGGSVEDKIGVPLETVFPAYSGYNPVGYRLEAGGNLTLTLNDYEDLSRPPLERIGGIITGNIGIRCNAEIIDLEGDARSTFEAIRQALDKTYCSDSSQVRKLKQHLLKIAKNGNRRRKR